ncbi:zinc protease [Altererythrobacter atlanticus]|uniref:Protease 3 n=1 Tax=Croceibacterium atlanticum TaxID=1267766 RepID=A0A0F7KP17_9SPHN|nr:M16 family metallopeptidase [Croceibacterium atlanticum]AKH42258.1 Protease 3 precursor [Croceibacterium atlanticum]MBB5731034.1 zinc protease [Croceibacterium atlanticum]
MTFALRALRIFAPALLLSPLPAIAQDAAAPQVAPSQIAPAQIPAYAQPDDPWIYRGTDIPVDREWLFGEMPNGVRYAVRDNGVPPGQVSIRVRIDAGSLHETDEERGFAHLIEHLTFRESTYLGDAEAIPHFQRLGATLGSDTNAITSPTQTVFKLDLPNARPATLEESMRLLSGMVREPVLSQKNVDTEVPIVLAERRERGGPDARIADASRELFFAGQPLAERGPIGLANTLEDARADAVKAFHQRWYRPENAVIVVVGDADPQQLAVLVERYFGDWEVPGDPALQPDFGEPHPQMDVNPDNPVGMARVMVEPGQPRGFTYGVLRPWHQVTDNLEYNRGLLIDAIAEAVINRRLESRARSGGNFLYAAIEQQKTSRSADLTYVSFAPLSDDWKSALSDVRSVIARALAEPPTQAEIDREMAEFDVVFANQVEQERIQAGSQLADDIVNAVDIREAVAAPDTVLNLFRDMKHRFTPEAVHEHTRALFRGKVIRAMYLTPEEGEATPDQLRQALLAPVEISTSARADAEAISFAELPEIGTPAQPLSREPLGIFDVEKLTFANGVRALLWNTDNEPGRATVRVRFGRGWQDIADDEAAYAALGQMALVSSGLGPLGQEELDQIATGRKLGFNFRIEQGTFEFEGMTRAEDVADQLYLFAAKLEMPRWDVSPVARAKAAALLSYDSYRGSPNAVLARDLDWLLHDRDPRYRTPTPEQLQAATPEGFREVWSRLLKQGPIEVDIFGDFDREAAIAALSRTFGAMPPREVAGPAVLQVTDKFPEANDQPLILTHEGEADQAAAVIAWPTGGGSEGLPQSRKLQLLAEIFNNRLMDAMRERAGASYSPVVNSQWPLDVDNGGRIVALAQLSPMQVNAFFDAADDIAQDLAETGPTEDEIARVTEPMRQLLYRLQTGHTFWLNQLEGASFDSNRLAYLPSLVSDLTRITPQEVQALAARYLGGHGGWRMAVMPEMAVAETAGKQAAIGGGR